MKSENKIKKNAFTGVNVATDKERINDSLVEKLKCGQDIKAVFFVTFLTLT